MLVILSNFPLIYISYFPLLISAYILWKRPFNKLSIPIPVSVASSPCIHEMCCNNFHTYLRSHTLHVKSEILLVALRTITLNAFATYFYFEYCVNVSLALKERKANKMLWSASCRYPIQVNTEVNTNSLDTVWNFFIKDL